MASVGVKRLGRGFWNEKQSWSSIQRLKPFPLTVHVLVNGSGLADTEFVSKKLRSTAS